MTNPMAMVVKFTGKGSRPLNKSDSITDTQPFCPLCRMA